MAEASERLNVIADFAENEKPLGHTVWFFAPPRQRRRKNASPACARSLENREKEVRVRGGGRERVRRGRRTWSARASPGRRGRRPRGAWPVSVAGVRETEGEGGERSGVARGGVCGTGVAARDERESCGAQRSSRVTSRSRPPKTVRDRCAGAGRERARTDEACMLLDSRKRTDDPSGTRYSLRARRRGRMAASAQKAREDAIDRVDAFF